MTGFRTAAYHVAFVLNLGLFCIASLPLFVLPRRWGSRVGSAWGRSTLWLLGAICGLTHEVRGAENLPRGAVLVASKHQSAWETLALLHILDDPAMVLKRELARVPLFGWYAVRFGHLAIDRAGGAAALRGLLRQARTVVAEGRPIVIFPEGTRRPVGARPDYQRGVAALYGDLGVACVPAALNSGLYWPRQGFARRPGRIVLEFLAPIPPGLRAGAFLAELERRIEPATARLVAESVVSDRPQAAE